MGSTLRARPVEEKAAIVRGFRERFGAAVEAGRLAPVVDQILPMEKAAEAHRVLEASTHVGKVLLRV
jgi:NADPH:quinone reductase-like Zn-dependent oxidoreductase